MTTRETNSNNMKENTGKAHKKILKLLLFSVYMVFRESLSEEVTFEQRPEKRASKSCTQIPGARPPFPTQEEQGRDSQGCFLYVLWPRNEYMYREGHLQPTLSFSLASSFAALFINYLFCCHISFLIEERALHQESETQAWS